MLRSLSSEEITAWRIYEEMEPFGERAEYQRAADLMALLYNLNRSAKAKALTPADFMPETFKPQERPVSPREGLLALAQALGAKVRKRGESS